MAAFLAAPLWILLHASAAILAIGLGLAQLALPKGTFRHRTMGWLWVGLMAVIVVTSFLLVASCDMGLSWIHILSVVTAFGLVALVRDARAGRIRQHRSSAFWLVGAALLGAGLFTLLPGRLMHDVVFGTSEVHYACS